MAILNDISQWFLSIGIQPVLGGFIAGLVIGLMLRKSNQSATVNRSMVIPSPQSFPHGKTVITSMNMITFKHNGNEVVIADDVAAKVRQLLNDNEIIPAIKLIREATGLGLAEAKDLAETLKITFRTS